MTPDLDWLILGGGIHGTLLACFLTVAGVPRTRLLVLDPHDEPLAVWRRCSRNVGMQFMRSPSVHHLDVPAWSMRALASEIGAEPHGFAPPYHRPRLDVFDAHCERVVTRHGLRALRQRATAHGLRRTTDGGLRVETDAGPLRARRVVLAVGSGHALSWPAWAEPLRATRRVDHVLDDGFSRDDVAPTDDVIVVGGSISAAQLGLALAQQPGRTGRVHVLARRPPQTRQFDTDPGWLGPRYLAGFQQEPSLCERRRRIVTARSRGTIPPEEWRRVRRAVGAGALRWTLGEGVSAAVDGNDGRVRLRLRSGDELRAHRVILATGFDRTRPLPGWIEAAAAAMGLPRAACGTPVLDDSLRWSPGLHVMGAGAELVLGPTARNISGARMAAQRLVAWA